MTGTETAILAAAAAQGTTEIRHAASEPHVGELCRFLRTMGADIEGDGTSTIRVSGAARLGGAAQRLGGDYIEAGSWAVVAAVTGGGIEVRGVTANDLEPIVAVLSRMNVECTVDAECLVVHESRPEAIRQITTAPWPGFPSDMVSLVSVLATQARGRTLIHDWMYELRLFALEQLSGMGADLFSVRPSPDDREWTAAAQWAQSRHARPAIRHGADRGGTRRRGDKSCDAFGDRRAGLRESGGAPLGARSAGCRRASRGLATPH